MDSSAIPVFLAGPYPVLHTARVLAEVDEVELDVGLIIEGQPMILASARFSLDDSWERVRKALASGDARLGVAGLPYFQENVLGQDEEFPSAYIGLECANGERLVLAHIRGLDQSQKAEAYAREVIGSLLDGFAPDDLGEEIED
jgi:hypothetical protein